ncbi:hypothetical protein STEG23_026172 [Scotinomys teguina]
MQPGRTKNTGGGTMEMVAAAPCCHVGGSYCSMLPAASHRVDGSDAVTGDERFTAVCLEKNHQDHRVTRKHLAKCPTLAYRLSMSNKLSGKSGNFERLSYLVLAKFGSAVDGLSLCCEYVLVDKEAALDYGKTGYSQLSLEVLPPLMFPMTVTPLGRDQDCSLKIQEPEVPAPFGSWILEVGARPPVSLYFIFPGICTLSLPSLDAQVLQRSSHE